MRNFFKRISRLGTTPNYPRWQNRCIIISNNAALGSFLILIFFSVAHQLTHPGDKGVLIGILLALVTCTIPLMNRAGHINISRTLLTFILVDGALMLSMAHKFAHPVGLSILTYYQSRTAIIIFSIVPMATINFKETKLLIINVSIGLLTLLLYDPIHHLFGIGFYQMGLTDPDYYYVNIISSILFLGLFFVVGSFKREMDTYVHQNEDLIDTLHLKNSQIEEQKEELSIQSELLKEMLVEKDKDLLQVTHQLVNFNHELLQFSYTVSHHLRGPVARILGLLEIVKKYSAPEEKEKMMEMILQETYSLDTIIHDLNKIVEARSDSFTVREKVVFEEEVNKICKLLSEHIRNYNIQIITEFNVSSTFSASKRINYILFTLFSNSIQYRRPEEATYVKVSTHREKEWVVLEVEDNGRGIDLDVHKDDLFKPFRYFHPDVSGKGISLYLSKLQAARLGGRIDVRSTPEKGTTFSVYLKDWIS